jgi:hypothetical protein
LRLPGFLVISLVSKAGENAGEVCNTETHLSTEGGSVPLTQNLSVIFTSLFKNAQGINLYLKNLWTEAQARSPLSFPLAVKVLLMHHQLNVPHD